MGLIFKTADGVFVPVGCTVYKVDGSTEILDGDSNSKCVAKLRYSSRLAAAQGEVKLYERVLEQLKQICTDPKRIATAEASVETAKMNAIRLQES